jgi:hypothetical protein
LEYWSDALQQYEKGIGKATVPEFGVGHNIGEPKTSMKRGA